MPGFMEGYGARDEVRIRWIKRVVFIGLPSVLVAVAAFFYFRTWSEERVMARFLEALKQQQFDAAYALWCPAEAPCRNYPIEKFREDWGPGGVYGNPAQIQFGAVDYCGQGVVFEIYYPSQQPFGLWVERGTGRMSFAPWQRCPGKHFQPGALFRRLFG
jgi:hypothetical protein